MNDTSRLLADIGGTHARFALQPGAGGLLGEVTTLRCADHATLADAIRVYLDERTAPQDCAIAIANPVDGDRVRMTNHHWEFSITALQAQFGFRRLRVLNDFTALALALPLLGVDERRQVGGSDAAPDAPIGLIGPGTGLGVSGLLPDGRGGWIALQGEGGHATLAGCTPREHAVLQQLHVRHGHASAERAVSGRGLVDIHAALRTIDTGQRISAAGELDPAAIVERAAAGSDPHCAETVELFCAFLGTAAGNLALTLGARGGVYIGGGIVPRLGALFDRSPFRSRFEAKGRFSGWLASIPVWVIVARQSPALRGAATALDQAAAPKRVLC